MGLMLGILKAIWDEDVWVNMDLLGDGTGNMAPFKAQKSIRKALGNERILSHIFSCVPTNLLLSSCSLVSKSWNSEARKFIRDHRKCTVANTEGTSVCEFLQELDQFCRQITENGRLVPFNSFKLDLGKVCDKSSVSKDDETLCRIITGHGLQLKHLAIIQSAWLDRQDCRIHRPLLTLFQHVGRKLKSLRIDSIHPFMDLTFFYCLPPLTELEELDIAGMGLCLQKPPEAIRKNILGSLLKDAPNLKRITAGELKNLCIVPEEILVRATLQGRLEISLRGMKDFFLLCFISKKALNLSELCIHEPRSILALEQDGMGARREFDISVDKIFQASSKSLETIEIIGAYRLPRLSPVALINVSKLVIKKSPEGNLKKLWRALASSNFERLLPRLKEVEVSIYNESMDREEEMWSQLGTANSGNRLGTGCKLRLFLKNEEINLGPLAAVFSNVSTVHLTLLHEYLRDWGRNDAVSTPISEIFKCWPNLRELNVIGKRVPDDQNYDADFCGILEEEAELLRRRDEDFLREVHIVPIRPCLLTMSKLQKLVIESDFQPLWHGFESPYGNFISTVAIYVAFDRMAGTDVSIVDPLLHGSDQQGTV